MNRIIYCVILAFLSFSFFRFPHKIVGHWISKGPDNSTVELDFNSNESFKVTVNGATENEGTYHFKKDLFTMYDKNCGTSIPGNYKIIFYTEDSASFKLIADSCTDRAGEVNGGIIKRVR
ncbi:MAG: hypothetical protein QM764_12780 [Chitinophagaceae bacterium]